jgi:hypothetical protein
VLIILFVVHYFARNRQKTVYRCFKYRQTHNRFRQSPLILGAWVLLFLLDSYFSEKNIIYVRCSTSYMHPSKKELFMQLLSTARYANARNHAMFTPVNLAEFSVSQMHYCFSYGCSSRNLYSAKVSSSSSVIDALSRINLEYKTEGLFTRNPIFFSMSKI